MLTIEHVATEAMVYPERVLQGCQTGLALFSAGFQGRNDVIHLALAGLTVTCVDNNPDLLEAMRDIYPDTWEFVEADAYRYAEESDRRWDVVTVDPWTNQFFQAAAHIEAWCARANTAVVLGAGVGQKVRTPHGWTETERMKRSDYVGGVYWVVLER